MDTILNTEFLLGVYVGSVVFWSQHEGANKIAALDYELPTLKGMVKIADMLGRNSITAEGVWFLHWIVTILARISLVAGRAHFLFKVANDFRSNFDHGIDSFCQYFMSKNLLKAIIDIRADYEFKLKSNELTRAQKIHLNFRYTMDLQDMVFEHFDLWVKKNVPISYNFIHETFIFLKKLLSFAINFTMKMIELLTKIKF